MGRALVIGCGGTLGFAWTAEVLAELEQQGWDPTTADVLVGTSAGAELVAMLGAGITAGAIASESDPRVRSHLHSPGAPGSLPGMPGLGLPGLGIARAALTGKVDPLAGIAGLLPRGRGNADWLVRLGDALAPGGWVDHPDTWLIAADARTGHRVPLGRADSPATRLSQAIAASWAIPGWFPPVDIGGRPYLDGGTISPTSADLLLPAVEDGRIDEVVIVAPMSNEDGAPARGLQRLERALRKPMTRRVDDEVEALRRAGAHVRRIEPTTADLAAMGANFMDGSRRDHVREVARAQAPDLVTRSLTTPKVAR
ncbi:patatin-like phospholipase family protein [Nocardioides sp. WS12]|uniref:patatin-like phospholipase family protein n=1 Tax=Nocardioides sp. WS12 TaxID=2486272 RepID=UPI0015FDAA2E|nr:patatin-like phospholipase family protein [Nocardioides sp. WS12]